MSSPSFPPLFFLYLTLLWPVVVTIVCQRAESARSFLCDCIAFMPLRMLPWRPGVTTQRTSSTFGQPHVPQPQLQCPAVRDRQIASWLTLWCAMPSDGKALHKQWQPPYSPSHERVDDMAGERESKRLLLSQPIRELDWVCLQDANETFLDGLFEDTNLCQLRVQGLTDWSTIHSDTYTTEWMSV